MDDDKKKDMYGEEPEIVVTDAQEIKAEDNGPPIPPGHSRFYCCQCRTPYDLPDQCTSWRCSNCMKFNSTTPGECDWCTIL